MKYIDPFIGEIELEEIGETSRHAVGESIVDTLYKDDRGNYYINTWTTTGNGDPQPMTYLWKDLVSLIHEEKRIMLGNYLAEVIKESSDGCHQIAKEHPHEYHQINEWMWLASKKTLAEEILIKFT